MRRDDQLSSPSLASAAAWVVSLRPAAPAKPSTSASVTLHLEARAGYHVNTEYPLSFRPEKHPTVSWASERLSLAQALSREPCPQAPEATCKARVPLPFVPLAKGTAHVAGLVAFSVCNPDQCLIEKVPLALDVPVD